MNGWYFKLNNECLLLYPFYLIIYQNIFSLDAVLGTAVLNDAYSQLLQCFYEL
jgi:hypothetical protein